MKVLRQGRYTVREEITAFEEPRRIGYRVLSGFPVRAYDGEITLAPEGSGTRIDWRASFEPKYPGIGPLLAWLLRRVLANVATKAAGAAT